MVMYKDFSFFPPKNYKPNKQTTWITNQLHDIALGSGKFQYNKLFDVFHNINTMDAEVLVKGLKKFKLVSRLLGQNVENVDDYDCPKIQDLIVAEEGRIVSWICSSYPFRYKSRLHCAERKANVYGEWVFQDLNL